VIVSAKDLCKMITYGCLGIILLVPCLLFAGSQSISLREKNLPKLKDDPELLPIKIKLKFTPDKSVYEKGDTVKVDIVIKLDKSNKHYYDKYQYAIISDSSIYTDKNSICGWWLVKNNLKDVETIGRTKKVLHRKLTMIAKDNMPFFYGIRIVRLATAENGVLLDSNRVYYDCIVDAVLYSSKIPESSRINPLYKRSERFIKWGTGD
jgi:sensor c-di-GMP phosphodiesterase-like protein